MTLRSANSQGHTVILKGERLLISEVPLGYRGTSLTRRRTSLGPYRRPTSRFRGGSQGVGRFLMGEVLLG